MEDHKLACMGIWTPKAKVICFDCHGNTFYKGFGRTVVLDEAQMAEKNKPVPVLEGNRITTCGSCGRAIQLDDSVAAEHNIVVQLREAGIDAEMQQTGGMNSACGVRSLNGGYFLVTYNWDGDRVYVVGEYEPHGESIMNEAYFVSESPEAVIDHIKSLSNAKRIQQER